jgi:hypothetical protein
VDRIQRRIRLHGVDAPEKGQLLQMEIADLLTNS